MEDAQTERIESAAAISGALDELQSMDLSFHGAVAPVLSNSGEQGSFVMLEMLARVAKGLAQAASS